MRADTVRLESPRPLPCQVGQASSYTSWRPWHSGQVSFIEKPPPTELTTTPAPSQVAQMCGRVPGLPPVPEQVGQGASELSRMLIVVPSIEAGKVMVVSV